MDRLERDYRLMPRDPLVLGDGRPLELQRGNLWPQPATLAAALNSWGAIAYGAKGDQIPGLVGPVLVGPNPKPGEKDCLWVAPPVDVRVRGEKGQTWVPPRLFPADCTYAPPDTFQPALLAQPMEKIGDNKLAELRNPVPLGQTLTWALGDLDSEWPVVLTEEEDRAQRTRWDIHESRMHVVMDDASGAAMGGGLFRTAGVRLPEGFAYAFRLRGGRRPILNGASKMVQLGGESRQAELCEADGLFPAFDAARFQKAAPESGYLRLQLLTPGWFAGDWPTHPTWERGLKVVAMCLGRYQAFSGWRGDQPREVRRVVPAGSVYWIGGADGKPLSKDCLMELAKAYWLQPIEKRAVGGAEPHRLGYGLCLPGFALDPATSSQNRKEPCRNP
jgi:hypothetical protein